MWAPDGITVWKVPDLDPYDPNVEAKTLCLHRANEYARAKRESEKTGEVFEKILQRMRARPTPEPEQLQLESEAVKRKLEESQTIRRQREIEQKRDLTIIAKPLLSGMSYAGSMSHDREDNELHLLLAHAAAGDIEVLDDEELSDNEEEDSLMFGVEAGSEEVVLDIKAFERNTRDRKGDIIC